MTTSRNPSTTTCPLCSMKAVGCQGPPGATSAHPSTAAAFSSASWGTASWAAGRKLSARAAPASSRARVRAQARAPPTPRVMSLRRRRRCRPLLGCWPALLSPPACASQIAAAGGGPAAGAQGWPAKCRRWFTASPLCRPTVSIQTACNPPNHCCLWLGGGGAPDLTAARADWATAGTAWWGGGSSLAAHQAAVQPIASRFEPTGNPCPSFRPVRSITQLPHPAPPVACMSQ